MREAFQWKIYLRTRRRWAPSQIEELERLFFRIDLPTVSEVRQRFGLSLIVAQQIVQAERQKRLGKPSPPRVVKLEQSIDSQIAELASSLAADQTVREPVPPPAVKQRREQTDHEPVAKRRCGICGMKITTKTCIACDLRNATGKRA